MQALNEFEVYAVLPTKDYAAASEWYLEKLGLKPAMEEMGSGWYRCANGTWFTLTTSANAGTAQNTAAGFTVTGIEDMMSGLRERGVEFLEYDMGEAGRTENGLLTIGGYKVAWFKDPDGNIIELSETPTS